jgi:hypothetical protein
MTDRTLAVFPIGHYMGERHPEKTHVIRVGLEHRTVSEDEFGVWVLAHGLPQTGGRTWTLGDVLDLAASSALPGAEDMAAALVGSGLLMTIGQQDGAAQSLARSYRVDPLLVGHGNSEDEPDRYGIGWPGSPPVVVLDPSSYELWQWGHVAPSLWHTYLVRERVSADLGEQVQATTLLDGLLDDLRELLASSCAYLDLARQ